MVDGFFCEVLKKSPTKKKKIEKKSKIKTKNY